MDIGTRVVDFIHWFMLLAMTIGGWMLGNVTIWWFILQLILVMIVGCEVGFGVQYRFKLTTRRIIIGSISATLAFFLGAATAYMRILDASPFGWGWRFETITAIIATSLVFTFTQRDIRLFRQNTEDYPRSYFLKLVFGNAVFILFWIYVMQREGFGNWEYTMQGKFGRGFWWLQNAGLTFNTIVGNLLFLRYWILCERFRKQQKVSPLLTHIPLG